MATKAFTVYGEIALKGAQNVKKELAEATTAGQKFNAVASSPQVQAAAVAAATAVAAFAAASVKAYIASEVNAQRLISAVNATGESYEDLADTLNGTVSKAMRSSAYDDDDLIIALATLTQTTGDVTVAQENLALVTDVARGKNIDLKTAAELVGKVAAGNTGILSRYGIILEEGATSQEALAMMQERFAGQAEAYGKTIQGSMERAQVAYENIQEAFGKGLVGDTADEVGNFADTLDRIQPVAEAVGSALRLNIVSALKVIETASQFAGDSVKFFADKLGIDIPQSAPEAEDATVALAGATGDYGDEAGEAAAETDALTRAMDGAMVAADSLAGKTRTLTDLDIANRTAQLDLSGARQRLNDVMADSESTADDVARAQLGVESAELRAADAAADMEAAVKTALSEDYPNDGSIQSVNEVIKRINAASLAASHFRTGLQTALNEGYTGRGEVRGPQVRHGGGMIATSGMYSLQAGEMVLRETQVERLIDNGGSVTQSAQVVIIADPRYTDMAKLDADVARINSGDVSVGAMLGLMGMTG